MNVARWIFSMAVVVVQQWSTSGLLVVIFVTNITYGICGEKSVISDFLLVNQWSTISDFTTRQMWRNINFCLICRNSKFFTWQRNLIFALCFVVIYAVLSRFTRFCVEKLRPKIVYVEKNEKYAWIYFVMELEQKQQQPQTCKNSTSSLLGSKNLHDKHGN